MKEKSSSRSDRVAVEPELHEIYKKLSEGSDPEDTPFGELKDVFMMATCLGYAKGKRKPLSGKRDIIRWETFSRDIDVPVLYALAIAETGDVEILDEGFEFLTIAEEYANSGIHILNDRILNQRGRPLWNLVDLVRGEIGKSTGK
jgi:dnd system-associated protein 4